MRALSDKAALFPPPKVRAETNPLTPWEQALAEIWGQVLGLTRIGRHDHFFELGGHSLAATRIIARCRRLLAADVSVTLLFERPVLADFAAGLAAVAPADFSITTQLPRFNQRHAHRRIPVGKTDQPDSSNVGGDRSARNLSPLSYAQLACFFRSSFDRQSAVENLADRWRLVGPLDVEAFRGALQTIVNRHESLRSIFRVVDGEPWQSTQPFSALKLPLHDLRCLSERALTEEIECQAQQEAQTAFDLAGDLLLRGRLLRVADNEHLLLLTQHHIASDGLSQEVLWRELQVAYRSLRRCEPIRFEPLSSRYHDYVARQREYLRSADFQQSLNYWQQELQELPALELPADRSRPSPMTYRGGQHTIFIPEKITQGLQDLGRTVGTTLHVVLLAAFHVLMARYSGKHDFAIGVPVAGRDDPDDELLVGAFMNTLAVRLDLSDRPTFRTFVRRAHEKSLAAYDHREVPFERLIEELHPRRSPGRNPLVQVLFQLLMVSEPESIDDVQVIRLPSIATGCHVDLELCIRPHGAALNGEFIYSADLFDPGTVERIASHYLTLLTAVAEHAEVACDRIRLLNDQERCAILKAWNQTESDYPQLAVSRLFERQVARKPDAVAVRCAGKSLSYAELNARANRLAHLLRKQGIRPEEPVGICVERSFSMLIGLVAILKAGGAYVPLDFQYPDERLAFILADAGIDRLLIQRSGESRWAQFGVHCTVIDDESSAAATESAANHLEEPSIDQCACIIYTSGSTGVAKGVEVLHRGIVRLLHGVDYVQLDETQTILQLATLSFDASTFEIWGPLLHGGRCVLAPPGLPDFDELQQLIQRENIRIAWLTSTLFNAIVDDQPGTLAGLEQLLIGGEALSPIHVRRAQQSLGPQTQLINGYGPTECTTFAVCYQIPFSAGARLKSVPIGRPIGNTQAYVLDEHREPVPIGAPGELFVAGAGLARGYLKRPELTADRYVPDPFSSDPDAKMYRTGDLVRWLADGNLEFLRRIDQQVKLRGFRIEPGEIESVLMQHAQIKQVAVLVREDTPGDKRLVAYYVPQPGGPPQAAQSLGEMLRIHLPAYMIPSLFVEVAALPRTPQGKIDQRALPAPGSNNIDDRADDLEVLSPNEQLITAVWRDLFDRPSVGVHENFFDMGGHSLTALRMIDAVNRKASGRLTVADVFACPTAATLAERLNDLGSIAPPSSDRRYLELLQSGNGSTTVVGIGTNLHGLVTMMPDEYPVWWLKVDGVHVWPHRNLSVRDQAEIHASELVAAGMPENLLLFGFSFGGLLACEIARQLTERGWNQLTLVLLEPSLVDPRENRFLAWIKRHWRKWSALGLSSRISYVALRIRDFIKNRWRSACLSWKCSFDEVPEEQRWDYCKPFLLRKIRAYRPAASLNCEIHLMGRPEYLDEYQAAARVMFAGKVCTHFLPEHLQHHETIDPKFSRAWLDVIQDCLHE